MRVVRETVGPDEVEIVGESLFGAVDVRFDSFLQRCEVHRFKDY